MFIDRALLAPFLADRRILRSEAEFKQGKGFAVPRVRVAYALEPWAILVSALVGFAVPCMAPWLY